MTTSIPLCIDCHFYVEKATELDDLCTHAEARYGGVRQIAFYTCSAMRAGICRDARLFEPKGDNNG